MIAVADPDRRPPSRTPCPTCGATPGACRGREYVSGRWCCDTCAGDHGHDEVTR